MNYIVSIEGQTIPVPLEVGENDQNVRNILAPYFPDAANALITRKTEGETVTINVAKRAGTKGLVHDLDITPLNYLASCAGGMNPAIALYQRIQSIDADLDVEAALELDDQVAHAIDEGRRHMEMIEFARNRLGKSKPMPSPFVILGF